MYPDPTPVIVSDIILESGMLEDAVTTGPSYPKCSHLAPGLIVRSMFEPAYGRLTVAVYVRGPGGMAGREIARRLILTAPSDPSQAAADMTGIIEGDSANEQRDNANARYEADESGTPERWGK